ncbi:hypothetical protein V6Z11_D13G133800 [Gossypium hirsutum]
MEKGACASKGEGRGIGDGSRCDPTVGDEGKGGSVRGKSRRGEVAMRGREDGLTRWFGKGRRGFGKGGDSKGDERGEKRRFGVRKKERGRWQQGLARRVRDDGGQTMGGRCG